MKHMEIWNKVKQPPAYALKSITGGRLKGMTDIKPQWRLAALTEVFGPCGVGWKYTIDKLWTDTGPDGQVVASAIVSIYYKQDGKWSDPTPGVGGSMLAAKETSGLRTSDEAYKMAVTDAISVAAKSLGVAADIYMGCWDGSKYKETGDNLPTAGITQEMVEEIEAAIIGAVADRAKFLAWVKADSVETMTRGQYAKGIVALREAAKKRAAQRSPGEEG